MNYVFSAPASTYFASVIQLVNTALTVASTSNTHKLAQLHERDHGKIRGGKITSQHKGTSTQLSLSSLAQGTTAIRNNATETKNRMQSQLAKISPTHKDTFTHSMIIFAGSVCLVGR